MKTLRRSALPVLMLAVLLSGCATTGTTPQTPLQRLSLAEQSYRVALDSVHQAFVLGYLKPADLRPWIPVERGIGAALDAAYAASQDPSNPTAFTTAVAEVEAALPKLAPLLGYIERRKASVPVAK